MLQAPHHFCVPPLNSLQYINVFLVLERPKLDIVLQMLPHKFPCPSHGLRGVWATCNTLDPLLKAGLMFAFSQSSGTYLDCYNFSKRIESSHTVTSAGSILTFWCILCGPVYFHRSDWLSTHYHIYRKNIHIPTDSASRLREAVSMKLFWFLCLLDIYLVSHVHWNCKSKQRLYSTLYAQMGQIQIALQL